MKERPILMHARSVNGILAGRKSQTRRIIKPQPHPITQAVRDVPHTVRWYSAESEEDEFGTSYRPLHSDQRTDWNCPFGVPGDRLWVRECFSELESFDFFNPRVPDPVPQYWYWADGNPKWGDWTRPKPSIYMPRIACRLMLEVTGIRVERVQDISEEDARAEGVYGFEEVRTEFKSFAELWDDTNGPKSWESNPWVWVVSFRRVEP